MRHTALVAALFAAIAASQDVVYDYVIAGAGTAGLVSLIASQSQCVRRLT